MCAVCGFYRFSGDKKNAEHVLDRMLKALRHRGPDDTGKLNQNEAYLGHARLSIVGLKNGRQPISNEDQSIWTVCAGEIFNYIELKKQLEAKGHYFRTLSDSEVIVHLYEEYGIEFLDKLNGQYAFVIWDSRSKKMYLVRDRLGILPLFYTRTADAFIFASEIKSILCYPGVRAEINLSAIDQVFTFWTTVSPQTMFKDIFEVKPGHYLCLTPHQIEERKYWDINFPTLGQYERRSEQYYVEHLKELLIDAVRIRLRADVTVGTYLSGGIDSGIVTAIAVQNAPKRNLPTFSVRFVDKSYDESYFQEILSDALHAQSFYALFHDQDALAYFSKVVWHAETPVLRTAPIPLFILSKLVQRKKYKAVLAGEGADEFLIGYDVFKELKVRNFWSKRPQSHLRPALLNRLYPYLPFVRSGDGAYLKAFFGDKLEDAGNAYYSHILRWKMTARNKRFFSKDLSDSLKNFDAFGNLSDRLNPDFKNWDPIARAQYLESTLFLSGYLLSVQGDRMAMAHGVEVRYPFLDHRFVEFCNQIPPNIKMKALREKHLLKKIASSYLPSDIVDRQKQPYRAPYLRLSRPKTADGHILDQLSNKKIKDAGYFDPVLVKNLVKKASQNEPMISEIDNMALNGILSLQFFHEHFIKKHDFTEAVRS